MAKLCSILLVAALPVTATVLAAQTPEPTGQPTVESVMVNNDLNKDGLITRDEATRAGARLIQQWDMYDLDKNNKVDKSEIAQGLALAAAANASPSSVGGVGSVVVLTAPPLPTAEAVMENSDLNKDGLITRAEATSSGPRLVQQWDMYDVNKDNKLDKAEIAQGLALYRAASAGRPAGDSPRTATAPSAPAAVSPPPGRSDAGASSDASATRSTNKN